MRKRPKLSKKKEVLIDTNLIIRFLVNDDPVKSNRVKKLLQSSKYINILLDTVVAEIIWVLSSYYEIDKVSIIEKIRALIHVDSIQCNKPLLNRSLSIWENNNISFIDSYIVSSAESRNIGIFSYDLKFDKVSSITRHEP